LRKVLDDLLLCHSVTPICRAGRQSLTILPSGSAGNTPMTAVTAAAALPNHTLLPTHRAGTIPPPVLGRESRLNHIRHNGSRVIYEALTFRA
jgi:hypothetical protein